MNTHRRISTHSANFGTVVGIPGEVVTAAVRNPLENSATRGKARPVVLIYRDGASWWIMGLTTNPTFADGRSRVPIPNPSANGLRAAGFLWGNRLTRVCVLDLGAHVGWVDAALAEHLVEHAKLDKSDANALRAVASARTRH